MADNYRSRLMAAGDPVVLWVSGDSRQLTWGIWGVGRVIAITDGTAGSGLSVGASTRLGGRRIRVTGDAAVLDDGTLAGSTLTMDRAFKTIVTVFGLSVCEAAMLCSTTPARELGVSGLGVLAEDAYADITVLDRHFHVVRTFVGGREVYSNNDATVR